VILEMEMRLVEPVGDGRTARTTFVPVGVEHEVVHEQLRPAVEQVGERGFAAFGVEEVVLVDPHPRQLAPLAGNVVVESGQFLLGLEQLEPGFEPLVARSNPAIGHGLSLLLLSRPTRTGRRRPVVVCRTRPLEDVGTR
jgi:hypothetical protein